MRLDEFAKLSAAFTDAFANSPNGRGRAHMGYNPVLKTPYEKNAVDETAELKDKIRLLEAENARLRYESKKRAAVSAPRAGRTGKKSPDAEEPVSIKPPEVRMDPASARNAIVMAEIIGPPVSKKRRRVMT